MHDIHIKLLVLLLTAATTVFCATSVEAKVVTFPAPSGETTSGDYKITINGRPLDAYIARTLDEPFAEKKWDYGGPYSFANFDMSEKAIVRITSPKSMRNVMILPKSSGIKPTILDDHTVVFTLHNPKKLSIEPNGKKNPLLLFANQPEENTPKPDDPNVIYFGPGIHNPGKILLGSGQTLYLAGGAVVKGEVLATGDNIRICGSGILDGSDWAWKNGPVGNLIDIRNSNYIDVKDITLRGSSHWSIVLWSSKHVTVQNVKICNSRVQNDDGIDICNSQDVLITDCFIRSDDDCVALKGIDLNVPNNNVERITVENCILWCDRARIFLLGHESRAKFMRDVTIKNIDIIHFSMTPFLFEPGEEMQLENILVEEIRINGAAQQELIRLQPVVNKYMLDKVPGHIRNVTFRNLKVEGQPGKYLIKINGSDPEHTVQNVYFDKINILGQELKSDSPTVSIGNFANNVRFRPNLADDLEHKALAPSPLPEVFIIEDHKEEAFARP